MPKIDGNLQQFHLLLTQLEGGALAEDLTESLHRCIREIADVCADRGAGKHKAKIALTIEFAMDAKDKIVEISAALTETLPKTPRGRAGVFFADETGNLLRESPRQMDIEDELSSRRRAAAAE